MVMGKWPVESGDRESTTCSQCHATFATRSETQAAVCPRCKALVSPLDGQPWGTPIPVVASNAVPDGTVVITSGALEGRNVIITGIGQEEES